MTDTDRPPDPIDVLEHAMFTLDEEHYEGSVLLTTRMGYYPTDDEVLQAAASHPKQLLRCFCGQAIVQRPADFSAALEHYYDGQGALDYELIAHVYQVPEQLVQRIGQGVMYLTFAEATDYVRATIAKYRRDPEAFLARARSGRA